MGLFDTIARIGTAIVTGGTSELVRAVSPGLATSFTQLTFPTNLKQILTTVGTVLPVSKLPIGVASSLLAPPSNPIYANLGSQLTAQGYSYDPTIQGFTKLTPPVNTGAVVPTTAPQGGTMALDLNGILGGISSIFGGNQNPVFSGISGAANIAQQFFPTPSVAIAQPVMAMAPRVIGPAIGAVRTLGRGFFSKYPNLGAVILGFRQQGRNITRAKLYSLLKRFGPELLISGGILTAAAVSELMVAGPGRRRMNPGNVKALRRSLRRLESFHHLCQRADKLRRPRARSKGSSSRGAQQFVRQG
jgi:hypothetical protein